MFQSLINPYLTYILKYMLKKSDWPTISNCEDFFKKQKDILEYNFLGEKIFINKNRKHTAYRFWEICNKICEEKEYFQILDNDKNIIDISPMILNTMIIDETSGKGKQEFKKKFFSRIISPALYEDFLVELYSGYWYEINNFTVERLEKENYPDLQIKSDKNQFSLFVECKRLTTKSENRIRQVIRKANFQLKEAIKNSDYRASGILILDISTLISNQNKRFYNFDSFKNEAKTIRENIFLDIETIKTSIKSSLVGKNHSIERVIIVWDEFLSVKSPKKGVYVAYRLRTYIIDSPYIKDFSFYQLPLFDGFTSFYFIDFNNFFSQKNDKNKIIYYLVSRSESIDWIKVPVLNYLDPSFIKIEKESKVIRK